MNIETRGSLRPLGVLAIAVGLLIASFTSPAVASWIKVPLNEAALSADLIVVGRLVDIHEIEAPPDAPDQDDRYLEGTIRVERLLWPEGQDAGKVTLRWNLIRPYRIASDGTKIHHTRSGELHHERREGERVLWLLDKRSEDAFMAGYNGTVSLESDASVRVARFDLIEPWRYRWIPAGPEPWKADPRLTRIKLLFDETLAEFDAAKPRDH